MKLRLIIVSAIFCILWLAFGASLVRAVITPPKFPGCPNPGGTLKVSYASGTHGVPGDPSTNIGSDSVYVIDDHRLVQCFCPESGPTGIQTNWWQVDEISQSDINHLKALGWIFVPSGSAWGLNDSIYFAYNSSFSCRGDIGGFSPPGPGSAPQCTAAKPPAPVLFSVVRNGAHATLTWSAVPEATHYIIFYGTTPGNWQHSVLNTGRVTSFTIGGLDPSKRYFYEVRAVNDCAPSDPSSAVGGGQVLGAAFAPTGNITTIILIGALGLILLGLSLLVKKHESRRA